jgi:hypothetical protein
MTTYRQIVVEFEKGIDPVAHSVPTQNRDNDSEKMLRYVSNVLGYREDPKYGQFVRTDVACVSHYLSDLIDHTFTRRWINKAFFVDTYGSWVNAHHSITESATKAGFKLVSNHGPVLEFTRI